MCTFIQLILRQIRNIFIYQIYHYIKNINKQKNDFWLFYEFFMKIVDKFF